MGNNDCVVFSLSTVYMIISKPDIFTVVGFPGLLRRVKIRGLTAMELLLEQEGKLVPEIQKKAFVAKHKGKGLEDYSVAAPESFRKDIKFNSWETMRLRKCDINVELLERLATETKFPNETMLGKILEDLKEGARIGVNESYRVSSSSSNAPSAIEHGEEVTDALLDWIDEDYVIGPYDPDKVPFRNKKISGLMCRIKPNGKARIIINFSKGRPSSVNEGINKDEYPTAMSSTTEWIRVMLRCGRNCRFSKCDWSLAYKQIRVHPEDVWMQGFAWLGKIFFELALVFGSCSSPGIYDRLAKLVLYIAISKAKIPSHLVIQHLDDVCACSPEGSEDVDRFYATYHQICDLLKIKLADKADPDKSFSPRTVGQVLGVDYDSMTMTWSLRQDKMSGILSLIREVLEDGEATVRTLKKICGKLVDIRNLIPGGKFHLAHLLIASSSFTEREDMERVVELEEWCKSDLYYFSLVLPAYSSRTNLQDPDRKPDTWAVKSHTNAAGGSTENLGRGVGMTIFPHVWTYVPWGRRINEGWTAYDGKKLSHKMSAWELVGPLLTLVCGGNRLSGRQVEVIVDNVGSVTMWAKGWSTVCDLCNTVLVAMHQVSTALACELFVTDIGRCSNREAIAADALSKCDMQRFLQNMPEANVVPEEVPGSLLRWLENPVPDRHLGTRILNDMRGKWNIITY